MAIFSRKWRGRLLVMGSAAISCPAAAGASSAYQSRTPARLLDSHNAARAAVGQPPLAWDAGLQAQAASYAAQLARTNKFRHSSRESRGGTGENLWMGTRAAFSIEEMFADWAAGKARFRPGVFPAVTRGGSWHDVGHFTQIVWPQTTHVGCAIAANASYDFLVCHYWPAGNVHGVRVPLQRQLASNARR